MGVMALQSPKRRFCYISAMLRLIQNPRPLLPTAMGGSQEQKWSQNRSNLKHKNLFIVKPPLCRQQSLCSAMLPLRAIPRPLLPTAMGGSREWKWSQNRSNLKHKDLFTLHPPLCRHQSLCSAMLPLRVIPRPLLPTAMGGGPESESGLRFVISQCIT